MSDRGLKKAVIMGAGIGALVSVGIALSMDVILSDSLQGTWRDAAVKDVTRMFGPAWGQNYLVVTLVLVFVMAFLAAFGAFLGALAGAIVNKFFKIILK